MMCSRWIVNCGLVQSAMAVLLDFALACDAQSTLWDKDGQANNQFSVKMSGLFFRVIPLMWFRV